MLAGLLNRVLVDTSSLRELLCLVVAEQAIECVSCCIVELELLFEILAHLSRVVPLRHFNPNHFVFVDSNVHVEKSLSRGLLHHLRLFDG